MDPCLFNESFMGEFQMHGPPGDRRQAPVPVGLRAECEGADDKQEANKPKVIISRGNHH